MSTLVKKLLNFFSDGLQMLALIVFVLGVVAALDTITKSRSAPRSAVSAAASYSSIDEIIKAELGDNIWQSQPSLFFQKAGLHSLAFFYVWAIQCGLSWGDDTIHDETLGVWESKTRNLKDL